MIRDQYVCRNERSIAFVRSYGVERLTGEKGLAGFELCNRTQCMALRIVCQNLVLFRRIV